MALLGRRLPGTAQRSPHVVAGQAAARRCRRGDGRRGSRGRSARLGRRLDVLAVDADRRRAGERLPLHVGSVSIRVSSIALGSSPLSAIASRRSASARSHEGQLLPPQELDSRLRHMASLAAEDPRLLLLELGVRERAGIAQLHQALELGDRVAARRRRWRLGAGTGVGRRRQRAGPRRARAPAAPSQSIAILAGSSGPP